MTEKRGAAPELLSISPAFPLSCGKSAGHGVIRGEKGVMSWQSKLAALLMLALTCGCASFHRAIGIPNTYRVLPGGHDALEQRTREHLEAYLASDFFKRRKLTFGGDVVLKPVPAVRRDRLGVPFYTSLREETRDRSGGLTLYTGRKRPVVIVIAMLPDGAWDDRTLKHEACHAILLWNGITGHPPQYRHVAPLWR